MKWRNRFLLFALLLAFTVTGLSCASKHPLPPQVYINRADLSFERADGMFIRYSDPYYKQRDLEARAKVYDEAMNGYLNALKVQPSGKPAQWAHFRLAEIYKRRYDWLKMAQHYQEVTDLNPASFRGESAAKILGNFRENRARVQALETQNAHEPAAETLFEIAQTYRAMGDYPAAIKSFEKLVSDFPTHALAPQAQFQIGDIYFYALYDYSNEGGWGAFVKVVEQYPDSYEALQATEILKDSDARLRDIIRSYTRIEELRRQETQGGPTELYIMDAPSMHSGQRSIADSWIQMKNYPYAIAVYRGLTEPHQPKYLAADSLYRLAELYRQQEKYHLAIPAYEELLSIAPDSTLSDEARYFAGVCYQTVREFEKASEFFNVYLRLYPNEHHYQEVTEALRQIERETAKAEE